MNAEDQKTIAFVLYTGLTLLDLSDLGDVGLGHIAARQELREMIAGLAVPGQDDMGEAPRAAAAG